MIIRRYRNDDLAAVYDLHVLALKQVNAYMGEGPWDDDFKDIEGTYLNQDGEFLVGEIDGCIMAMGAFKKSRDGFVEVKRMRVSLEHQGKGYGSIILKELERRARELGYVGFLLETSENQWAARKLYLRHGFKEIGTEIIGQFNCIWFEKKFVKRSIEEFSINAWPALQTLLLDGWLLRFADGYTKRSNSISALYEGSEQELVSKIEKCEEIYRQAGQPVLFKITPFVSPLLDRMLEDRGYKSIEPSLVMELDNLSAVPEPSRFEICIESAITREWVDRLITMNGMAERDGNTTLKLFDRTLLHTSFFTLYDEDVAVACGIGVANKEYVGLFDIVTHPDHRNKGCGEQLLYYILKWAREYGATKSCLMVLRHNPPANRLYEKLNYKIAYPYGYRVKA
jgi:GNAT superfamily N-acetyltransferase